MTEAGEMAAGTFIGRALHCCDVAGRHLAPSRYLLSDWVELGIIATAFAVVLLTFVRLTGLGGPLRRARRNVLAAAYEILLYRRRPRAVIAAEARLAWSNLKYLFWLAPLVAFGGLCFTAVYRTCSDRYGRGPARVGEPLVVRCRPAGGAGGDLAKCTMLSNDGDLGPTARAEAPAVGAVWTRFTPRRPGIFALKTSPNAPGRVLVNVDSPAAPAICWQYVDGLEVHIQYPLRKWWRLEHGWVVYFLAVSTLVSGLVCRRLGVRL